MKYYITAFILSVLFFSCSDSPTDPSLNTVNINFTPSVKMDLTSESGEIIGEYTIPLEYSSTSAPVKAELYKNGILLKTANSFKDNAGNDGMFLFNDLEFGSGYKIKVILNAQMSKESGVFSIKKENSGMLTDTVFTKYQLPVPSWFKKGFYFEPSEETENELTFNYSNAVSKITVSPNPAKNNISIKYSTETENTLTSIIIQEPNGQIVKQVYDAYDMVPGSFTKNVDISALPNGIYFVHLVKNSVHSYSFFKIFRE